jgi:DNA-directed RNA polymerase sigma subunit (sigma70/sigma32)
MRDDAVRHWMESAQREPLLTPAEELHLGGLVRAWQDHPGGPDHAPPAVIRRGRRARDRIITANLRLVASYVQNRRHDGPLEDRFQNGALGLCKAAEKFDPARGYKFSTYAFWWLRANIDKGEVAESAIRLPTNVHAAVRGKSNGECPTASLDAGRAAAFVMSLDYILPGEGVTTLGDLIAAPGVDPDVADLYDRIDALDAIQQRLVLGRWGDPPQSYAQLASQEAISAGEVRKMLDQAMDKLRGAAPPLPPPAPPLVPYRLVECCQLSLGLSILNPER